MNQKIGNRGDLLLQKWLNGTINWQEERELEQLAKGDPMLADALEGMRALPESNHLKQVENLKTRLQERVRRKRRGLIFYLPRVAAAAAVIGALAFGIQYFTNNVAQKETVAQIERQDASDEQQAVSSEQQAASNESKAANQLDQQTRNEKPATKNEKQIAILTPPPAENTRIAAFEDTNLTVLDAETSAIAAEEKPAAPTLERAKTLQESPALQKPSTARSVTPSTIFIPERIIIGKLTDLKGKPLAGVVVSVDGKDTGTTTSLDGDFVMSIPLETKELVFSHTGFETTAIQIGKDDTVAVQLKEDGQRLNEVVVSDYAAKKRTKEAPLQVPEPRGGFEKLKNYIQRNLRYPKAAQVAAVAGKVVVEFVVQTDGSLSDFKIIEALGYGCDEEAIRLLKGGPKWELRNKVLQSDTASYTIEFKLKN